MMFPIAELILNALPTIYLLAAAVLLAFISTAGQAECDLIDED